MDQLSNEWTNEMDQMTTWGPVFKLSYIWESESESESARSGEKERERDRQTERHRERKLGEKLERRVESCKRVESESSKTPGEGEKKSN